MVNPYDRCIENSIIDGKQCTIAWYFNDNKVLHIDENLITRIIEAIVEHFGELTVSRAENHKFLEMII